jgi:hypothetical protein
MATDREALSKDRRDQRIVEWVKATNRICTESGVRIDTPLAAAIFAACERSDRETERAKVGKS